MAHSLIFGQTESGKTTLGKRMSAEFKAKGIGVLVLDPLNDPGWSADFKTSDAAQFLDVYWRSKSCMCFIDESADVVGRYDAMMIQTATRGRHWGHCNFYLSQRGALISRTVRDQCSNLFLFKVSQDDSKLLAKEFCSPELMNASALQRGEYYYVSRFNETQKRSLW